MSKFLTALPLLLIAGISLNVCASEQFSVPQVDLAIKTDGQFVRVQEYVVPEDHIIGDGTIAYEGPGIESSKVAYRLYLDERSVLDVFGKKTAEPVLQKVGRGDDYHTMSDWGMDILKVGNSLGSGGLGVLEENRMRMVGPAQGLSIKVSDKDTEHASFTVNHKGLTSKSGLFDLETRYSIERDSRLLSVQASSSGQTPALAAGLVIHPGVDILRSAGHPDSSWAYVGTYGVQTLVDDQLGLALFYQPAAVTEVMNDSVTIGIIFNSKQAVEYKVAAAWVGEPDGISDKDAFKIYLNEELMRLEKAIGSHTH
jgi:hypothetical protein